MGIEAPKNGNNSSSPNELYLKLVREKDIKFLEPRIVELCLETRAGIRELAEHEQAAILIYLARQKMQQIISRVSDGRRALGMPSKKYETMLRSDSVRRLLVDKELKTLSLPLFYQGEKDPEAKPDSKTDPEFTPTHYPQGTAQKLNVLAQRAQQGQPLWHPDDKKDLD